MEPTCALKGYKIPCSGRLHIHHLINYSKARGNKKVRKILKTNPPELVSWVCAVHNVERYADEKEAQAILFRQKVAEHGFSHMARYLADLPWKQACPELSLEALLDNPFDSC